MSLPAALSLAIAEAVLHHGGPRPAALEALRLVQAAEGWVSDARLAEVAGALGLTTAELDSIATFYSLIFRKPVGQTVILLCDGASCWMNGSEAVRQELQDRLGITYGQTTEDGKYTLINVACLGACHHAPAAAIGPDRRLIGPLSPEGVVAFLEAMA